MTIYNFQPSVTAPFQFKLALDGSIYNASVEWNLFGQRWYLNLRDQSGNEIYRKPLVSSKVGPLIAAAVWDFNSREVTVTTAIPHNFAQALTLDLTIAGMAPAGYNGTFECFVTSPTTFTYRLDQDPGAPTVYGTASYDINLVYGYFSTSRVIWRGDTNVFEVTP